MDKDLRTGASFVVPVFEISQGGDCQIVAIGGSSLQSTAISVRHLTLTCTAAVFIRQGTNPTAVADGTDQYLTANITYSLLLTPGNKIAFIKPATGSDGTAYITPVNAS